MTTNGHSIWLEINLGAIRRNIQRIQELTNRPVMAVVKANAYGHGLLEVSKAASQAGAIFLCVARIEEAFKIRQSGNHSPILVMGYTKPEMVLQAINENLSLGVSDFDTVKQYRDFLDQSSGGHQQQRALKIHAKVDSGMGRLGVIAEKGLDFCRLIDENPDLELEGVFTHFASADEVRKSTTRKQLARFNRFLEELNQAGVTPRLVHAANSAALLNFPEARFDAVRPGIAIYGLDPSPETKLPPDFERALSWKCLLASVKELPKGSGVGYGHKYHTKTKESIGVIAAGYADGLRRWKKNIALLHGRRVHQAGSICMDQSQWLLDGVQEARVGDEVVLVGRQGNEMITAEEIAENWGTINYEVVCGLTDRVHRIFIETEE